MIVEPQIDKVKPQSAEPVVARRLGPIWHVAIGGVLAGLIGGPLITNPWNRLANPNPLGYLVILLGFPIGAIVYRFRTKSKQVSQTAIRNRNGFLLLALLGLLTASAFTLASNGSIGYMLLVMAVLSSILAAILLTGVRRP